MKTVTKLSLIAATVAAFASSAALAGDSQLENRLAMQRAQAERNKTTIAVYADRQGVGQQIAAQNERTDLRVEWRTPARGVPYSALVPAR
jgi:hypothetical protein